jgi:hypothetical protein
MSALRRPAGLKLRGPIDLRHTFEGWLQDGGLPTRRHW